MRLRAHLRRVRPLGLLGRVETTPQRPRPRSAPPWWRVWVYPVVLLGASCTLAALERDPQDDLDGLVAVVERGAERGLFFRHERAALGVFPRRGWTLTLYVGDTRRFAPGTYLVLTRIDGRLSGELILEEVGEPGPLDQETLSPDRLDAYLARSALDLRGLDGVAAARFGAPGPLLASSR